MSCERSTLSYVQTDIYLNAVDFCTFIYLLRFAVNWNVFACLKIVSKEYKLKIIVCFVFFQSRFNPHTRHSSKLLLFSCENSVMDIISEKQYIFNGFLYSLFQLGKSLNFFIQISSEICQCILDVAGRIDKKDRMLIHNQH